MKRVPYLILFLVMALLVAPQASATIQTLQNKNTTVNINDSSSAGMTDWVINGTDIMYQQWFWYRIGNNPEKSIDTLGLTSATNTGKSLDLVYGGPTGLSIEVTYTVSGGSAGKYRSDVDEIIQIFNNARTSLDFHFFQYADFDLARNLIDYVKIDPSLHMVNQVPLGSGGFVVSETTENPSADRAEANYFANTRGKLNDGVATNLDNVLTAGPGDVTWAFQWDRIITAGDSFQISKDMQARPVPEPASLALVGGILVFLARKFRPAV